MALPQVFNRSQHLIIKMPLKYTLTTTGTPMKKYTLLTALLLAPLASLHAEDKPSTTTLQEMKSTNEKLLKSADALWNFCDPSSGTASFQPKGDVRFGIELEGTDKEESLKRGGNGRVAKFNGGYLSVEPKDELELKGKHMTLLMRIQDSNGAWNTPLLSRQDKDDKLGIILYGKNSSINYRWRTTPLEDRADPVWLEKANKAKNTYLSDVVLPRLKTASLNLEAPLSMVGNTGWHDVIVRFRDANLELFVDGVLIDEEWPHGALHLFKSPFFVGAGYEEGKLLSGFQGQIERVAIWNKCLSDEEIESLSGGKETVAKRDLEILGPGQNSMQYWKPRGLAGAGDGMAFFHDGTFHLFYLYDRHRHKSKWGMAAHQIAHASTRDLVNWTQHPLALPIKNQWEMGCYTGDLIWHDGTYHFFYGIGGRGDFRESPIRGDWIMQATSKDGINYHKDNKPIIPGGDAVVFRDPETGLFHLSYPGTGQEIVSSDLVNWKDSPTRVLPVRDEQSGTSNECPDAFEWNGWHYYFLGGRQMWKSRSAIGPWEEIPPVIYDGMSFPKVAEFTGNRRLSVGNYSHAGFGGNLAIRELTQNSDGTLGTKWVDEMIPKSGSSIPLKFSPNPEANVVGTSDSVRMTSANKFTYYSLESIPMSVRVTMKITPEPGTESFGLCFRGTGNYQDGLELCLYPSQKRAQFGRPLDRGPANEIESVGDKTRNKMGWWTFEDMLKKTFTLDAIVSLKGNVLDVSINGKRTMLSALSPQINGEKLFFFVKNGSVKFEDIKVRPLLE
jgi:beta-fructofuranosidase